MPRATSQCRGMSGSRRVRTDVLSKPLPDATGTATDAQPSPGAERERDPDGEVQGLGVDWTSAVVGELVAVEADRDLIAWARKNQQIRVMTRSSLVLLGLLTLIQFGCSRPSRAWTLRGLS